MNALLLIYLATLSGYFAISPDFSYKQYNRGGFATVNDIQLHYERYGQGQPLLLLHGNAQAVDFLCLQIPALAQHFDVIAVDTRAHGQSASGDEPLSFELLAADLDALLQWLAIPSAHIVGWSDGGNIGLVTALRYPHRVNRLVTMAANIFMDESVVGEEMMAEARRMLASAEQDDEPTSQHIARLVRLSLYHPRYRFEDLQAIACPVLVMAGETDVIKRSHTEAIAAHIPNARLHIARGETHHYPVRNPDGFNQTVIDFLTDDRLTGPL